MCGRLLVWRTSGDFHDRARRQAAWLGRATLGMIGAVSLWTPFLRGELAHRWFSWPGILFTAPVPVLVVMLAFCFFRSLARGREVMPFLCALGGFVLCFVGLGISLFPLIVPPDITIWAAASPRDSQLFLLVGAAIMIPIIIAYSGYAYWFSGVKYNTIRGIIDASQHVGWRFARRLVLCDLGCKRHGHGDGRLRAALDSPRVTAKP